MNRLDIRNAVRSNLGDAQITYYSDQEINDSIQDGYNEICAKSLCIVKSTTINWVSERNYYDFSSIVSDFLGVIGIFNNNTNQWLRDEVSYRDLDRIRQDWEIWRAEPWMWVPHSPKYTIVCPCQTNASGSFVLWYYAVAPTLSDDTTLLILPSDMQRLNEYYSSGDLLESAEEITKAMIWNQRFDPLLMKYKERCHNNTKALMHI